MASNQNPYALELFNLQYCIQPFQLFESLHYHLYEYLNLYYRMANILP